MDLIKFKLTLAYDGSQYQGWQVQKIGAGVQEKVLIVLEGRAAGEALGKKGAPVDAAVIGIIDMVNVSE